MAILNQTTGLANISSNFELFAIMIAAGLLLIFIVWILMQFRQS